MSRHKNRSRSRRKTTQAPLPRSARRTWEGRRAWHEVRPGESEFLSNVDDISRSLAPTTHERIRGYPITNASTAPPESITYADDTFRYTTVSLSPPTFRAIWYDNGDNGDNEQIQTEEELRIRRETEDERVRELLREAVRDTLPNTGFEPEPDDPTLRNIDVY